MTRPKRPSLAAEIEADRKRIRNRIHRALLKEIRQTQKDTWVSLGPTGRIERDRYCQGVSQAAGLALDIIDMLSPPDGRSRRRKQKR